MNREMVRKAVRYGLGLLNMALGLGITFLGVFLVRELNYEAFRDGESPEGSLLLDTVLVALTGLAGCFLGAGTLCLLGIRPGWTRVLSVLALLIAAPFLWVGGCWAVMGGSAVVLAGVTDGFSRRLGRSNHRR